MRSRFLRHFFSCIRRKSSFQCRISNRIAMLRTLLKNILNTQQEVEESEEKAKQKIRVRKMATVETVKKESTTLLQRSFDNNRRMREIASPTWVIIQGTQNKYSVTHRFNYRHRCSRPNSVPANPQRQQRSSAPARVENHFRRFTPPLTTPTSANGLKPLNRSSSNPEALSKDEARKKMMSWKKTNLATTPTRIV